MGKTYFVYEELRNASPMVLHRFIDLDLIERLFSEIGVESRISKAAILYRQELCKIYMHPDEFDNVAREVTDIFTNDADRGSRINRQIMETARNLIEGNERLLKDIPDPIHAWKLMEKRYAELFKFTWVHNALDFKDGLFTTRIFNILNDHLGGENVNEIFVALTTPKDKSTHFRALEKEIQESDGDVESEARRLADKYGWLGFGFDGPPWDEKHFVKLLNDQKPASEDIADPGDLGLSEARENLFRLAREVIEGTELRKEAMFHYYFALDQLFERLSDELGIPKAHLRYVYPDEIEKVEEVREILKNRVEFHVDVETPDSSDWLIGEEAEEFLESMDIPSDEGTDNDELHGQTSFPGFVKGKVKIVNEKNDMEGFEDGDVLVSIATNPELISAMKRASAFVTDRGGITCHAAIVSRELRIPCVIGTKHATSVLKDGEMIEVDADKGIVRRIE